MYFALLFIGLGIYLAGAVAFILDKFKLGLLLFAVGVLFFIAAFLYNIIPRKHVKKKRSVYTANYNCSRERVQFAIDIFMKEKGFAPMKYLDEDVYRKGNGWWVARRFIKYTVNDDNTVTIEGWIGSGVGNSVTTEMNLNGVLGAWPKRELINQIEELKTRISHLSD